MAKPTRYTQTMIDEYLSSGEWLPTTWSDIWNQHAASYPHKESIVDSRSRLTYAQAKQWIDRLALGFLEMGFQKDDLLVVQLYNCVELYMLRLACERAGLLCLPAQRTLRQNEMEYILRFTEAKGIVIPWQYRDFDYWSMVEEIRPRLPHLKHVFVIGDEVPAGAISIQEMAEQPLEQKYPPDYLEATRTPALEFSLVGLTTGTTGMPKFVENPICARVRLGRRLVEVCRLTGDDVICLLAPAAGGPGLLVYAAAPMVAARIVMLEYFSAEEAFNRLEKERVTVASGVPAQLTMMLSHPDLDKYDLGSLRLIYITGSPLPYSVAVEAEAKFRCPIIQAYGATDCGTGTHVSMDDPQQVRLLTVGQAPKGFCDIKLVDGSGQEVPSGEIGEVSLRGSGSLSGYYKDPEATARAWTADGWFRTGDLGRFNEQGNLVIVGRQKDMIIRGGQNIYPAEIENMLLTHPKVADVAIVGIPHPLLGESACAYVVPKGGQQFDFEDMVSFLKQRRVAPFKLPERLEIVDKLPLVAEQKVDKKLLRQDIERKLRAEGAL